MQTIGRVWLSLEWKSIPLCSAMNMSLTLSKKRQTALFLVWLGNLLLHMFVPNRPYRFAWAPVYLVLPAIAIAVSLFLVAYYLQSYPRARKAFVVLAVIPMTYFIVAILASVTQHWMQGDFWLGARQGWLLVSVPLLWPGVLEGQGKTRGDPG